jgi:nicotinamidase-related amidase
MPAHAATIIDEWGSVQAPPAPELKSAAVDAGTTALLVLDLVKQACNDQRRPRCVPTLGAVHTLLTRARGADMKVVYSLVAGGAVADILPPVAPLGGEPMVSSGTDKFLGTDLDAVLHASGIKTVIIVGTASHGAVMTTATEAALRGYQVVVALDGVSADTLYAEQYAAWDLVNAPVIIGHVTLSRTDLITF